MDPCTFVLVWLWSIEWEGTNTLHLDYFPIDSEAKSVLICPPAFDKSDKQTDCGETEWVEKY